MYPACSVATPRASSLVSKQASQNSHLDSPCDLLRDRFSLEYYLRVLNVELAVLALRMTDNADSSSYGGNAQFVIDITMCLTV